MPQPRSLLYPLRGLLCAAHTPDDYRPLLTPVRPPVCTVAPSAASFRGPSAAAAAAMASVGGASSRAVTSAGAGGYSTPQRSAMSARGSMPGGLLSAAGALLLHPRLPGAHARRRSSTEAHFRVSTDSARQLSSEATRAALAQVSVTSNTSRLALMLNSRQSIAPGGGVDSGDGGGDPAELLSSAQSILVSPNTAAATPRTPGGTAAGGTSSATASVVNAASGGGGNTGRLSGPGSMGPAAAAAAAALGPGGAGGLLPLRVSSLGASRLGGARGSTAGGMAAPAGGVTAVAATHSSTRFSNTGSNRGRARSANFGVASNEHTATGGGGSGGACTMLLPFGEGEEHAAPVERVAAAAAAAGAAAARGAAVLAGPASKVPGRPGLSSHPEIEVMNHDSERKGSAAGAVADDDEDVERATLSLPGPPTMVAAAMGSVAALAAHPRTKEPEGFLQRESASGVFKAAAAAAAAPLGGTAAAPAAHAGPGVPKASSKTPAAGTAAGGQSRASATTVSVTATQGTDPRHSLVGLRSAAARFRHLAAVMPC